MTQKRHSMVLSMGPSTPSIDGWTLALRVAGISSRSSRTWRGEREQKEKRKEWRRGSSPGKICSLDFIITQLILLHILKLWWYDIYEQKVYLSKYQFVKCLNRPNKWNPLTGTKRRERIIRRSRRLFKRASSDDDDDDDASEDPLRSAQSRVTRPQWPATYTAFSPLGGKSARQRSRVRSLWHHRSNASNACD